MNEQHEDLRLKWGIGRLILECYSGQDFLFSDGDAYSIAAAEGTATVTRERIGDDLMTRPLGAVRECGTKLTDILRKMKSTGKSVDSIDLGESGRTGVISADSNKVWNDASQLSRAVADRNLDISVEGGPGASSIPTVARFPGKAPIVLPIYHCGMDSVLPNKTPYVPRVGQKVTIVVGQPIDTSQMLAELQHQKKDPVEARKIITDHIQGEMKKLKTEAQNLHRQRL